MNPVTRNLRSLAAGIADLAREARLVEAFGYSEGASPDPTGESAVGPVRERSRSALRDAATDVNEAKRLLDRAMRRLTHWWPRSGTVGKGARCTPIDKKELRALRDAQARRHLRGEL